MFKVLRKKPILYASIVGGTIGVAFLIKDRIGGDPYNKDVKVQDKVIIVTGANTGIGKETALDLARRGAKVYMACRDLQKCEQARADIVLETKNKYVYCRKCDLASLQSIRDFVKVFNAEQPKLDVLINNAGVMRTPRSKTKEGFETQLGVNHMGHFLLTNLLLDKLKTSVPSRIVNISSVAHLRGRINKEDLNSDKNYDESAAYNQSKLANVLFTKHLATVLEGTGVTVNAVHPGLVDTEIIRHMSFFNSWFSAIFLKPFVWCFIKSPRQGAQTTIFCAVDPGLERITGKYFCNFEEAPVSDEAKDANTAAWLWTVSEKWTRLQTFRNALS